MAIKPIEWAALSAAEHLALAAAGETSPLAFTATWFNVIQGDSFRTNWHHHYYDHAAQRVIDGESTCVVINVAPGATKTEFWSIHLPIYCFAKFGRVRILNGSYSGSLVEENSSRARGIVRSSEFASIYGMVIDKDQVSNWTVTTNGKAAHQLISRSNGGQITGARGGHMGDTFTGYVMADDWDKPDDMFSDAKRVRSHTRLVNTLRSRRATTKTPFVFIQQRLHVDDSTAFILSGGMGLTVTDHIQIPAMINQEYIDALPDGIRERCIKSVCKSKQVDGFWSYWPEKDSIDDLMALRSASPYTFLSQYQQAPDSLEGGIFSEGDFRYYGDDDGADLPMPPTFEYRLITVDTAQKTNVWNDWTVFAEWGVYQGNLYRISYQRAKMKADQLRRDFSTFVRASFSKNNDGMGNLRAVYVEDKSSGTGLIQEVQGKLPIPITALPRSIDKLTRAMDAQPHHAAGKVILPYGDKNNFEFVSEVAGFSHDDTHKHDDQTDVMVDAIEQVYIKPVIGSRPRARSL